MVRSRYFLLNHSKLKSAFQKHEASLCTYLYRPLEKLCSHRKIKVHVLVSIIYPSHCLLTGVSVAAANLFLTKIEFIPS